MVKQFDIKIAIEYEVNLSEPILLASKNLKIKDLSRIKSCKLIKRSLDARKPEIKVNLIYEAFIDEEPSEEFLPFKLQDVSKSKQIHIIGAGPAGLFAALEAIHKGLKPIVFERGKDVRARRRDLAKINKEQIVNPESNYCFGEGGAGTYSDGKLYTRSKKRGDVKRILAGLIQFGADENIAIEAHPHIGTNKLPQIIVEIREAIIKCGGEINFDKKLTNIFYENTSIQAIEINKNKKIEVENLILATGHSARDIFELLNDRKIEIKAKPFALGVRVEHPQELINYIQYHSNFDNELLPPAAYKIVKQVNGKGVYSFCMCPGGIIAPCATAPNEIVTNGWSPSKRNNPYANSGIVVTIEEEDWSAFSKYGALAALKFQEDVEQKMFNSIPNNEGQLAPAQRLIDFVKGRASKDLPKCSYQPGIVPTRLDQVLPAFVANRLRKAFDLFGKSMKGYLTNEAVVVGVESRTSSPVSIPRDRESMQHTQLRNLYPVGEGAGYAGGIVSAAIDGMKAVEKIIKN
ncbi:MAG: FAD-dependent oxidoreductase [Flavobacteriales bacterium]|nr:FAD-dependent oxidoreductase [Flavobacteriales bacterium]